MLKRDSLCFLYSLFNMLGKKSRKGKKMFCIDHVNTYARIFYRKT